MVDRNLEAEVKRNAGYTDVTLRGVIDEHSADVLQSAFQNLEGIVRLRLGEVEKINSCGIEELMKVLDVVAQDHTVEYCECPEVIVDQFQMMDFSMYGRISSFYIRYLCESCGTEKMVLLDVAKDLTIQPEGREIEAPTFDCTCGAKLRIDDYLDFLDDHVDW